MLLAVITTGLFAKHKTNYRADVLSWNNSLFGKTAALDMLTKSAVLDL